jgi:hypothetical protein
MAGDAATITSLSNGCGRPSTTNGSICTRAARASSKKGALPNASTSITASDRISRRVGKRRMRPTSMRWRKPNPWRRDMQQTRCTVDLWAAGCAGSRLSALRAQAAAHKLHSARSDRYKSRELQNHLSGTDFSLFLPGGCPNDRNHRNLARKDFSCRSMIYRDFIACSRQSLQDLCSLPLTHQ